MSRPKITSETTLTALQALGATAVGDIDVLDWLGYLQRLASDVAADLAADDDTNHVRWKDAAGHLQCDQVEFWYRGSD